MYSPSSPAVDPRWCRQNSTAMSQSGTFETCSLAMTTSVYRESPEVIDGGQADAIGPEPDIPLLKMDSKTDSERHQSKIRQQKPGGRVAQLGPSGPGGEFVRAELAAL